MLTVVASLSYGKNKFEKLPSAFLTIVMPLEFCHGGDMTSGARI